MTAPLANKQLTALACAAFSSGAALGSKVNAATPAFLLSSTIFFCASSGVTELLGSWAISTAACILISAAEAILPRIAVILGVN
jgi:hypothetical protein